MTITSVSPAGVLLVLVIIGLACVPFVRRLRQR
jgi:hypothetical protein